MFMQSIGQMAAAPTLEILVKVFENLVYLLCSRHETKRVIQSKKEIRTHVNIFYTLFLSLSICLNIVDKLHRTDRN